MALNIKNVEVERLASEVAAMTHVTKTEAIKVALEERREQIRHQQADRVQETLDWLRTEVWPRLSPEAKKPLTKAEEDEILGYGPDGV